MERQLRVISGRGSNGEDLKILTTEEKQRHFRNVIGSLLQDAQDTWGELWKEFQGDLVEGYGILSSDKKGFTPPGGWPEFLEKMWILKHHLDHAKRFSEGKG